MSHWIIAPILLPLVTGLITLLFAGKSIVLVRNFSLASAALLVLCAVYLVVEAANGTVIVYALGNWQPPFGIVLVQDRLSALMVFVASVLGFFSIGFASRKPQVGRTLHTLMHFLLMGVNGAFLTGDLFNLFVFFEVLLLSSYALLGYGGGAERIKATLHYVVLNLAGSGLFLISVSVLYGITGTLNMAHMAERVASLPAADAPLVAAAAGMLLVVFALKAALVPLYFWLPRAYANTGASVACLFAIMTKVGVYAIMRIYPLIFGDTAGVLAHFALMWIWPLALLTLVLGLIGVLAANTLRYLIAYLVIVSVGTLLAGFALNTQAALSATLYYLLHSTWVCGAFFLLADLLARQRGSADDALAAGPKIAQPVLLGGLYFWAAVAIAGLPPLAGFVGKLMLLQAALVTPTGWWFWSILLVGSLASLIALSRAGSRLFWRIDTTEVIAKPADTVAVVYVVGLLLLGVLTVVFGEQVIGYTSATAQDVLTPARYIDAINRFEPVGEN